MRTAAKLNKSIVLILTALVMLCVPLLVLAEEATPTPRLGYPSISKDQFIFVDTHTHTEGIGDVGPQMMIDFPTYSYSAEQKRLTSYIEVKGYGPETSVVIGSGRSIGGTAGGGAGTRLTAYNTFAYESLYYFDQDMNVHYYVNGEWITVKVGDKWTKTVERKPSTGDGIFLDTYTIANYGLLGKGQFTLPISTITPTVTPTPTATPIITPTETRKFKLCGYVRPEPGSSDINYYSGFKVEVPGLERSVLANPAGYFEFENLPERSDKTGYSIRVTKPGYLSHKVEYITLIKDTEVGSSEQPVFMYPGDINADDTINMGDIVAIAKVFNTTINDAAFNASADLNNDKTINMSDVIRVSKYFNINSDKYPEPSVMHLNYVNVKVNDDIYITLNVGGIGGLKWEYTISSGKNNVEFVSKITEEIANPDAFTKSRWKFKAVNEGTATIVFDPSYGVNEKYIIKITKAEAATSTPTSCVSPTVTPKEPLLVNSNTLKSTLISTDSQQKIVPGKNIVFCPTLQMAWDELKKVIGEDIKLQGNPPLADRLNTGFPMVGSLSPESYVALAGYGQETIDKINAELKSKFKDSAPQVNEKIGPSDIIAYAFLGKNLSFAKAFESMSTPISFTSGSLSGRVKAFGINSVSKKSEDLKKQVRIYDYKSKNDFIVKLIPENDKDEIILAKVDPQESLYNTYSSIMKRINSNVSVGFDTRDTLVVPVMDFNIGHNYTELEGRSLLNSNFLGYFIQKAYQRTRFKLDENGAVLASEATIMLPSSIYEPKQLIFDRPYMVILKEKNAANPYLMIWVDNPELLTR
ncbi:dockerin type I domain-containing protein [Pseudobacteroides cellulosolvens]|uniref:Dockerin domain-containing protein n=1 Tax=Pseudobacteroides cellulosolvens ATCC 35603 = DSM 2933 TaxID=398512 RepID=A0A0L6JR86_9FIRM|nr:dockerin type I domain-containing protein [Pseudobacteroides cellulosolvens]KNY28288.1 hypothetical protein Bccel_3562 [Pseudobacteroides cellulosolvens ATCC 35603 = DSM 2933]